MRPISQVVRTMAFWTGDLDFPLGSDRQSETEICDSRGRIIFTQHRGPSQKRVMAMYVNHPICNICNWSPGDKSKVCNSVPTLAEPCERRLE